ncbi:hypothetical protein PR048_006253 [Dryococelus australis]|uniref:Uncharacterized protein n=1 Tax=Dryococelus australis TaxID=614101 RepID=A0ABQ9IAH9_9NEOP|nr:hypothetical protein PR048_006253 [Dryococelus australis]
MMLHTRARNTVRPRSVHTVRLEVIRQHIDDMPSTSTDSIARQMGVSHSTVWDVLWEEYITAPGGNSTSEVDADACSRPSRREAVDRRRTGPSSTSEACRHTLFLETSGAALSDGSAYRLHGRGWLLPSRCQEMTSSDSAATGLPDTCTLHELFTHPSIDFSGTLVALSKQLRQTCDQVIMRKLRVFGVDCVEIRHHPLNSAIKSEIGSYYVKSTGQSQHDFCLCSVVARFKVTLATTQQYDVAWRGSKRREQTAQCGLAGGNLFVVIRTLTRASLERTAGAVWLEILSLSEAHRRGSAKDVLGERFTYFFALYAQGTQLANSLYIGNSTLQILSEALKDINYSYLTKIQGEIINILAQIFANQLADLTKNGPTAKLWIQYFNMVTSLKQFIEAERSGNEQSHLNCVGYNKCYLYFMQVVTSCMPNRATYLYVQNLLNLKPQINPTEYEKFITDGYFTIRSSEKFWSGIWCDAAFSGPVVLLVRHFYEPNFDEDNEKHLWPYTGSRNVKCFGKLVSWNASPLKCLRKTGGISWHFFSYNRVVRSDKRIYERTRTLNMLSKKSLSLQEAVKVFKDPGSTADQIEAAGRTFVLTLYGAGDKDKSLNFHR